MGWFRKILNKLFGIEDYKPELENIESAKAVDEEPESEGVESESGDEEFKKIELEQKYRRLRVLEESKFGGQNHPIKIRSKNDDPCTLGHLLFMYYGIIPQDINSITRICLSKGKMAHTVLDASFLESCKLADEFIDSSADGKNTRNDVESIAYWLRFHQQDPRTGFYLLLDPVGMVNELYCYLSIRVSMVYRNRKFSHVGEVRFMTHDDVFPYEMVRKISKGRIGGMREVLDGWSMSKELKLALGVDEDNKFMQRGLQAMNNNDGTHAMSYLFRVFKRFSDEILRGERQSDDNDFRQVCQAIGKYYDAKGLTTWSSYFKEKTRDNERIELLDTTIQWPEERITPLGIMMQSHLGVVPSDIVEMLMITGDNEVKRIEGGEAVWNVDFITKPVTCCISTVNRGMIFVSSEQVGHNRMRLTIGCPAVSATTVYKYGYDNPVCNETPLVLSDDFEIVDDFDLERYKQIRDEASRIALEDEDTLSPMQIVSLGSCVDEHIAMAKGITCAIDKCWGSAMSYLLQAYNGLQAHAKVNHADRFDLMALREINYSLGYILNNMGCYQQSIAYLSRVKDDGKPIHFVEYMVALSYNRDESALREMAIGEERYKDNSNVLDVLYQRKAALYIEIGKTKEAREVLNKLLVNVNPEIRKYAANTMSLLKAQGY